MYSYADLFWYKKVSGVPPGFPRGPREFPEMLEVPGRDLGAVTHGKDNSEKCGVRSRSHKYSALPN